jgi:hypothetical protein
VGTADDHADQHRNQSSQDKQRHDIACRADFPALANRRQPKAGCPQRKGKTCTREEVASTVEETIPRKQRDGENMSQGTTRTIRKRRTTINGGWRLWRGTLTGCRTSSTLRSRRRIGCTATNSLVPKRYPTTSPQHRRRLRLA